MVYIPEPSHLPCPLCGHDEKSSEEVFEETRYLADRAYQNLKLCNLGFILGYMMTDLERLVYFRHQIRKDTFKEMSKILNKSESTLTNAWNRCKRKGDKALEELNM